MFLILVVFKRTKWLLKVCLNLSDIFIATTGLEAILNCSITTWVWFLKIFFSKSFLRHILPPFLVPINFGLTDPNLRPKGWIIDASDTLTMDYGRTKSKWYTSTLIISSISVPTTLLILSILYVSLDETKKIFLFITREITYWFLSGLNPKSLT